MNLAKLADSVGLEQEEYQELIHLFIERSMADLDALQNALTGGRTDDAAGAAHSLKGAALSLGLEEIFETAKDIEEKVRERQRQEAEAAAGALRGRILDLAAME
ncbi:MAG: Hpt domain-containing protein [Deltaproteobacteria bacterium]|nr:Hpt domain-containing protein [Deltaproteobacteria bacterium]